MKVAVGLVANFLSLKLFKMVHNFCLSQKSNKNRAGLLRQPKYGHLKELHKAIKHCEPALVSSDPTVTSLGTYQQVKLQFYSVYLLVTESLHGASTLKFFNLIIVVLPGSCVLSEERSLLCLPRKLQHEFCCSSHF